jgi:hypothetical protein
MGERYLIDTNAVIDFCNGSLPEKGKMLLLNILPEISIITNIELFSTKNISESEMNLLHKFITFSTIYPVDSKLIAETVRIRQNHKIKLPDAIIAATALVYNCTIITRNTKDFDNIIGLKTVNPHL